MSLMNRSCLGFGDSSSQSGKINNEEPKNPKTKNDSNEEKRQQIYQQNLIR